MDADKTRIVATEREATRRIAQPPLAVLEYVGSGKRSRQVPIFRKPVVVGRANDVDIVVDDPYVSRRHLEIVWQDGAIVCKDLSSRNGIRCGLRRQTICRMKPGQTLKLGQSKVRWPKSRDASSICRRRRRMLIGLAAVVFAVLVLRLTVDNRNRPTMVATEIVDPPDPEVSQDATNLPPSIATEVAAKEATAVPEVPVPTRIQKQVKATKVIAAVPEVSDEMAPIRQAVVAGKHVEAVQLITACGICPPIWRQHVERMQAQAETLPELYAQAKAMAFLQAALDIEWQDIVAMGRPIAENVNVAIERLVRQGRLREAKIVIDQFVETGVFAVEDFVGIAQMQAEAENLFAQAYALETVNPNKADALYAEALAVLPKMHELSGNIDARRLALVSR